MFFTVLNFLEYAEQP